MPRFAVGKGQIFVICPYLTIAWREISQVSQRRVDGSGQQESGPAPGACVRAELAFVGTVVMLAEVIGSQPVPHV